MVRLCFLICSWIFACPTLAATEVINFPFSNEIIYKKILILYFLVIKEMCSLSHIYYDIMYCRIWYLLDRKGKSRFHPWTKSKKKLTEWVKWVQLTRYIFSSQECEKLQKSWPLREDIMPEFFGPFSPSKSPYWYISTQN